MNGPKFEREWSEALRRLSLIVSGKWMVSFIGMPNGPGTNQDYVCHLKNVIDDPVKHVKAYGPNLASAVNKAIDKAKKLDPQFAGIEAGIAEEVGAHT